MTSTNSLPATTSLSVEQRFNVEAREGKYIVTITPLTRDDGRTKANYEHEVLRILRTKPTSPYFRNVSPVGNSFEFSSAEEVKVLREQLNTRGFEIPTFETNRAIEAASETIKGRRR